MSQMKATFLPNHLMPSVSQWRPRIERNKRLGNDTVIMAPSQNLCIKKRNQSNRKERKRNEEMNNAYARLQRCVPHIPHDQKLAKIKTLRLAMLYIRHLEAVVNGSVTIRSSSSQELRPLEVEDFASIAIAEIQARNNYKDLAEKELKRGIRTEDICRQTIPERYALQETSQDHFSSMMPLSYQSSSMIAHNSSTQISSFPRQSIADNSYYFPHHQ